MSPTTQFYLKLASAYCVLWQNKKNITKIIFVHFFMHHPLGENVVNHQQNIPIMAFNNSKHNKNLINFIGIVVLSGLLILVAYFPMKSRSDWNIIKNGSVYFYVSQCLYPTVLPITYFMFYPNHLISVLKDFNFLWM